MKQQIAALLPMKANSERVQGKNFREFCGKPLFRWILDTLLEVEEIDQVIILGVESHSAHQAAVQHCKELILGQILGPALVQHGA